MLYVVAFDLLMAISFFVLGVYFFKSNGGAIKYLTGYTKTIKSKDYEACLCREYGKKIITWSIVFVAGACLDIFYTGIGCLLAWIIWIILFIILLVERTKKEKLD